MKAVTIKELKTELSHYSQKELVALCLRMSKFKKENKELLTYLLFESSNEEGYISSIKLEIDEQFELINTKSHYFIKKSVRKILRSIKTAIRYSKNKETEVELLLYFCKKMKDFKPSINKNTVLKNLFDREIMSIEKKMLALHEDLQYDFGMKLKSLKG